jgi:hypothetical protein
MKVKNGKNYYSFILSKSKPAKKDKSASKDGKTPALPSCDFVMKNG